MFSYFNFFTLLSGLVSFNSFAQVRTTGWNCTYKDDKSEANIQFKKIANYDQGIITLDFRASVTGNIDGQEGTLSGAWSGNVDPRVILPNSSDYHYVDSKSQNEINISGITPDLLKNPNEFVYPGWLLSMKVKTSNAEVPYLLLKGVSLDPSNGSSVKSGQIKVTAYAYNLATKKYLILDTKVLKCESQFSEN